MPEQVRAHHEADLPRIHFQLELVSKLVPAPAKVLDVGGGFAAFAPALAFAGYDVTLVESFQTPSARFWGPDQRPLFAASGVRLLAQDATSEDFAPKPVSFDVLPAVERLNHADALP
jgi:2-polyprenyl-3-methyl-5-hydroxy-6-metoxy-1,4-benzoquinol methylase